LLAAGHAVVAVYWSSPDPAAVVSVPVAALAAAVLVGVPAFVDGPAFPGVSVQAWPVVPASSIPLSGPDARKLLHQIPGTEILLSYR